MCLGTPFISESIASTPFHSIPFHFNPPCLGLTRAIKYNAHVSQVCSGRTYLSRCDGRFLHSFIRHGAGASRTVLRETKSNHQRLLETDQRVAWYKSDSLGVVRDDGNRVIRRRSRDGSNSKTEKGSSFIGENLLSHA